MAISKIWSATQHFLEKDYASGIILFIAALLAILAENSPAQILYDSLLSTVMEIRIGELGIQKAMLLWINDGLMAVFFLHVGLEIKKEVLEGSLSDYSQLAFPVIAAIGGIIVPAGLYASINYDNDVAMQGWAIPTATDIAFALGVVALLGKRIPTQLKVFLLTLAVIDDLCAILIIAFFYTGSLSTLSLLIAGAAITALFLLNRFRITELAPYIILGIVLWVSVLKSGIHATLAGVVLALFIPNLKQEDDSKHTLLSSMEHDLKHSVYFIILPVFAFANAGVNLSGFSLDSLLRPVPMGILAGLFLGKQVGIFGFAFLAVKTGLAKLPSDITWFQLYSLAVLCGIGFSMSLFISSLAFIPENMNNMIDDRIGILSASLLSGVVGYFLLRLATRKN